MKRIINKIALFTFLFMFCLGISKWSIYAASPDDILTISASGTTTSVTVSGTTDTGVVAVAIEIFDASNNLVVMETHAVSATSYNATISATLVEGQTYTAYVVNYSGAGDAKETTFVATAPPSGGGAGTGSSSESSSGTGSSATVANATAPTKAVTSTAPVEPAPTEAPKSPKTGDNSGVLYGCVFVMGIVLFRRYMLYRQK